MDNLELYNKYAEVPVEAQKQIRGGRLKGMTDINPMWRIKSLTDEFGPAGIGWYTDDERYWMETGANGEIAAFCKLKLYVKTNDEWSKGISGIGGSALVAKEKNGLYTSDECYKMAYTDALSVACKALGFGSNVYWAAGRTKYTAQETYTCEVCGKPFADTIIKGKKFTAKDLHDGIRRKYGQAMCEDCVKLYKEMKGAGKNA